MESKTKQRIVGICVVIGLVIVLLPLFQGGKEVPIETTLVKAPPFPEQPTQVATTDSSADLSLVQDDTLPEQSLTQTSGDAAQPKPNEQNLVQDQNQDQNQKQNPAPDQKQNQAQNTDQPNLLANRPSIINNKVQTDTPTTSTSSAESENIEKSDLNTNTANPGVKAMELAPAIPEDDEQAPAIANVNQAKETKAPTHKVVMRSAAANHAKKITTQKQLMASKIRLKPIRLEAATGDNGLVSIKSSAWVVQIGSFKNKSNALRLVNKLRMNGYHAFMQHVALTYGENTRVFVGPESQHAQARTLASRLETDMHLKTIVLSYKPMTL